MSATTSGTMTATKTSPTKSKSPCGCGCSGSKTPTASSCGCSECATCQDQGYTRPLFFAGQLLTEDDLQQLTNYVVAKNRLHTRYLAGSGVVCGLQVTCEPCGGGKVIVNPGYALDCCGNDIVLTCPQTLDINKMVRDLKLKLRGGYDCGDPCAESGTGKNNQSSGTNAAANLPNVTATVLPQNTATPPSHAHKYCLYIDYCEQPTDPVSPYATDAPCGPTTSCQPTRVREGFRFELRCAPECEPEAPLCCAICNCMGDSTAFERTTRDSASLHGYGLQIRDALQRLKETPTPPLENPQVYFSRLADETTALNDALKSLTASKGKAAAKDAAAAKGSPAAPAVHAFSSAVFDLSRDIALLRVQPAETQRKILQLDDVKNGGQIVKAEQALNTASREFDGFSPDFLAQSVPTTLERAYVEAQFRVVKKLVPDNTEGKEVQVRAVQGRIQLAQPSTMLLAAGAVFAQPYQSAAADSLAQIRDWLEDHLKDSPQTCCDLQQEICALTLPVSSSQDELSFSEIQRMGSSSVTLAGAVRDVLRSCVCNALNPPCPTCDDTGVLLACLTVEDCKVKNICNMDREFVLTPLAVRYWFPEIQRLGREIEKWCCECGCPDKDIPTRGKIDPIFGINTDSPYAQMALFLLERACPDMWKRRDTTARRSLSDIISDSAPHHPFWPLVPTSGVATPDHEVLQKAVRTATKSLKEELDGARSDLESLQNEHKKLHEKVMRLEKAAKSPKGQAEA